MEDATEYTPITPELWDNLRQEVLKLNVLPSWVTEVLSLSFAEINKLPTSVKVDGPWRPQLRKWEKMQYLELRQKVRFARFAVEASEDHAQEIAALKQCIGPHVLVLAVSKSDGFFSCLVDEAGHRVLHSKYVKGHFGFTSKWRSIRSAWRWIGGVLGALALVSIIIAPTNLAALAVFGVSSTLFCAIVLTFGVSHVIEAGMFALVVAVLSGLLWGGYQRVGLKSKGVERMKPAQTQTNTPK